MKFGRVATHELSQIDFCLPSDPPATTQLLQCLPKRSALPQVHLGGSVWADRSLVGRLYPKKTPAKDFLTLYAQQFTTVELNATFYGIPKEDQVHKWRAAVRPGFRFCPKVPQHISHRTQLQTHWLDMFVSAMLHFEDALGMCFLQLPPHLGPHKWSQLQALLEAIPPELPMAVEVRHPGWFSDPMAQAELFHFLAEKNRPAVITDVAGRRDVLHMTLTTDYVFVRFTGNDLHPSDYERLEAWAARLEAWAKQGIREIYFLLHMPDKALCVPAAAYMMTLLNEKLGLQLILPQLPSS